MIYIIIMIYSIIVNVSSEVLFYYNLYLYQIQPYYYISCSCLKLLLSFLEWTHHMQLYTKSLDVLLLYVLIKVITQIPNFVKFLETCIFEIKNKFEKMFGIPLLLPPCIHCEVFTYAWTSLLQRFISILFKSFYYD